MTSLVHVLFFVGFAVLAGSALRWVLATHLSAVNGSRVGVGLFAAGVGLLIVAVVRYGQQFTFGLLVALVGCMACAAGTVLVTRDDV